MSAQPETIIIGPLTYTVTVEEISYLRRVQSEGTPLWGHCDHARGEITLWPDQSEQHRRAALLHEVLHGVFHNSVPLDNEEQIVLTLALPLLDVLRRNPALVDYLTGE